MLDERGRQEARKPHPLAAWMGRKVTREEMARRLGITLGALNNILCGFRAPGDEVKLRIAETTRGAVSVERVMRWHKRAKDARLAKAANADSEQAATGTEG